jgi:hypothetical protein
MLTFRRRRLDRARKANAIDLKSSTGIDPAEGNLHGTQLRGIAEL